MLIDCHIHQPAMHGIDLESFAKQEKQARQAGIGAWIVTGVTVDESQEVLDFIRGREGFFACVGIHPSRSDQYAADSVQRLADLAGSTPQVVGIGEIGLDYERTAIPPDVQKQAFRAQIGLARDLKLPINLHTYGREAANELIDLLHQERAWEVGGVLHNFMGNDEMALRLADMGIYASVSVVLMHPQANRLRGVLRKIPLGNLVMDTDWPDAILERTGPEDYPFEMDKKTELVNLHRLADRLADEKQVNIQQVIDVIDMNTRRAFPRIALAAAVEGTAAAR